MCGQMQEARKWVLKPETISITILLLKCFKQMQPQEQAIPLLMKSYLMLSYSAYQKINASLDHLILL